jgi:hypothetical protein
VQKKRVIFDSKDVRALSSAELGGAHSYAVVFGMVLDESDAGRLTFVRKIASAKKGRPSDGPVGLQRLDKFAHLLVAEFLLGTICNSTSITYYTARTARGYLIGLLENSALRFGSALRTFWRSLQHVETLINIQ